MSKPFNMVGGPMAGRELCLTEQQEDAKYIQFPRLCSYQAGEIPLGFDVLDYAVDKAGRRLIYQGYKPGNDREFKNQ